MFTQDWIMRQIEMTGKLIAKLLLNKETTTYDFEIFENTTAYDLHAHLIELISQGKINKAENLLFDNIKQDFDLSILEVAIDFYARLNKLSDDRLMECDFPREEVQQGMDDVSQLYGFDLTYTEKPEN